MADQLKLQTADGTATHTLDDSGNATHTGAVSAASGAFTGVVTVNELKSTTATVHATVEWTAASVDKVFFIAPRACRVVSITPRPTVAGTDGGAVTATIRKCASGTAIGSGTALHASGFDLKGTANTNQAVTLSPTAADLEIPAGTALAIDFTGTLTSATGCATIGLALE